MSNEIVSSAGSLGVEIRSNSRLYVHPRLVGDSHRIGKIWERMPRVAAAYDLSRYVLRTVMASDELSGLPLGYVEAAVSLEEFTGSPEHLVYMAHNDVDRQSLHPDSKIIDETEMARRNDLVSSDDLEKVLDRLHETARVTHTVEDETQLEALYDLWGQTFGWTMDQLHNFATSLEKEGNSMPQMWFAGAIVDDELVSAVMAERITIPTHEGVLELIENTEWSTRKSNRNQGLLAGLTADVNLRIIEDLSNQSNPFLIYAECNYDSRADLAGVKAGFRVPEAPSIQDKTVPQIIHQNVTVGSVASDEESARLRDFNLVRISQPQIMEYRKILESRTC